MEKTITDIIKHTGHLINLWLPLKIRYDKTPGLSVGIIYKGKLAYANSFGYADLSKKKKVDEHTLYHIASISKTFTSVAIMQLVDNGKLRLDDKVAEHIAWFKGKNKDKDSKNITIRQLLSHTAGLFRDGDTPHWATGKFPKDLQQSFSSSSLTLENATGFKYTNYGFSILGLVIQKVSGLTYEEYVSEHILKPLKMNSTAPDYSPSLKDVATGYGREIPDEERKVFDHYKTNAYAPATGFLSNTIDLAKYLSALSLDSKKKLLSREAKKEMMRPHEKTEEDEEYGLGLDIFWINKKKIVGHDGGFNGFITQVMLDPKSGIAVVVLTNSLASSAGSIAKGIFEAIYNALDNTSKHKGKIPSYKKYEGVYRNVWGDTVLAQFGKDLLAFSPRAGLPLKFATILKPQKNSHQFLMEEKSVFDARDEIASFTDFKSGKAQKFLSGAMPSKRIKVK